MGPDPSLKKLRREVLNDDGTVENVNESLETPGNNNIEAYCTISIDSSGGVTCDTLVAI
jgi:hypothetical protein